MKEFKEPHTFKHLVAPGLEHQQPAEWLAKCDAEYRSILAQAPKPIERVRFVTYTSKYFTAARWLWVMGLDEQYSKAVVDAKIEVAKSVAKIDTANIRVLWFDPSYLQSQKISIDKVVIDGQTLPVKPATPFYVFVKAAGKWAISDGGPDTPEKNMHPGPIDDAFRSRFRVVGGSEKPWNRNIDEHIATVKRQFAELWDKHLRGKLPTGKADDPTNVILFGDPGSNPAIAEVLPKLPIKWTKDDLVVDGVKYDAKTHYPALICPNPKNPSHYVVLNSGHTFKDADFRGTNALLYPRLGDWAVLKPKPTKDDPGAVEVVAAGIFDEFWQFKKEKK